MVPAPNCGSGLSRGCLYRAECLITRLLTKLDVWVSGKSRITIPLLIGGATTSALFTALRIAPNGGPVIHLIPQGSTSWLIVLGIPDRKICRFVAGEAGPFEDACKSNRGGMLSPEAARANRCQLEMPSLVHIAGTAAWMILFRLL